MNATISLDGLLSFIRSLSLDASSKQWLGEKLIREAQDEQAKASAFPCQYSIEELEHRLHESEQSYHAGDYCTSEELRKRHPLCK